MLTTRPRQVQQGPWKDDSQHGRESAQSEHRKRNPSTDEIWPSTCSCSQPSTIAPEESITANCGPRRLQKAPIHALPFVCWVIGGQ